MTFRNHHQELALPMRQWEAFLPGTGLGGCGAHWNGQIWRYQIADFIYKSHVETRYGKKFLDPDLRIQDWGVTYQELEPSYDRFEYLCGAPANIPTLRRRNNTPALSSARRRQTWVITHSSSHQPT
jgi:gluconate 2-dehydrogenase alpha chain